MEEDVVDEAKRILAGVEDFLPIKINEVTNPDQDPVLATLRGQDGYPVLAPHPESISILSGKRAIFELFVFSPRLIRGLLDRITELEKSGPETA